MSTAETLGIVAYSFALRRQPEEPNPCNVRLAEATADLVRRHPNSLVVAQWEVARGLENLGVPVHVVVEPSSDGSYLDSDAVWRAADQFFQEHGVERVASVAHPFLHLSKVRALTRQAGYVVVRTRVGRIGFDRSKRNLQWWTRGPLQLVAYAVMQRAFGYRGSSAAAYEPRHP